MGLFKKDNGVNWQQEVFDTAKIIRTIAEKQENIQINFDDHVDAGRKQRAEDKQQRIEDKKWQAELLTRSSKCAKADQIDTIQTNVDTLTKDKTRREGKFLGVKSVYVVGVGILGFAALVLGILWRLKVI